MNFVGRKQNCFFTKYLSLFCMFNLSQVVLVEDQLADVSTRFSTSASWRVAS